MLDRYRPDHSRRRPGVGSPCRVAPDPEIDNVCSLCGGKVPAVPMMLFGSEPRADGDIDAWVYCDDCGSAARCQGEHDHSDRPLLKLPDALSTQQE